MPVRSFPIRCAPRAERICRRGREFPAHLERPEPRRLPAPLERRNRKSKRSNRVKKCFLKTLA